MGTEKRRILLKGQLQGAYEYDLPSRKGLVVYDLYIKQGRLRLTHSVFEPSGTWSDHVRDDRIPHYDLKAGEHYRIETTIRESHGHLDRLYLLNPSLWCTAEFEIQQGIN